MPSTTARAAPDPRGLAATLTAAMAAGTLTQFLVGAMGPVLIPALGMSRAEFGAVTAAFFVAAAVLSPLAGRLCDDWGGQPLVVVTFVMAGVGFGSMSLARSHTGLILASLVTGIAGATANPSTNLVVSETAPRGRQGALIGIKQSGVQVGAFTSGFLPAVSQVVGWRWVLAGTGLTCATGAVLAMAGTRRRRGGPRPRRRAIGIPPAPDDLSRWLVPYAALMGIGGAAVSTYLPLYSVETAGFSVGRAGLLAGAIGLVGVPSRILWATASERRQRAAVPLAVIATGSVLAVALMLAALASRGWVLWVAAAVFGTSAAAWNAVGMLAIVRDAGPGSAGRVSGRVLAGFYVGLVVGPVPFGYVVDHTGTYVAAWTAVAAIYLAGAALALVWHRRTLGSGEEDPSHDPSRAEPAQ